MAVNSISNVGTGTPWVKTPIGADVQIKSVLGGTGITVSLGTDTNTIGVNQATSFTWTGVHNFGTPSASYVARFDPAYGDFYIFRSNNLPYNPQTFEYNAFAADITYSSGDRSLAPFRSHAMTDGGFAQNAWGVVTEAENKTSKQANSPTQLFGAELAVINRITTSSAPRHAGVLAVFKNRSDDQDTPAAGIPAAGNAYNKKTRAIYIDSVGRIGKIGDPNAGNPAIECGWQTGIYFDSKSLDSAGSDGKAVGIDLTPLAAGFQSGTYADRVKSGLALPTGMPITLSTDYVSAQLRLNATTGNIEFTNTGNQRLGVNKDNGCVYISASGEPANSWFIDVIGAANPTSLLNFKSSSRIASSATAGAATHVAPAGYIKIKIDGAAYKLAYYLN